MIQVNSLSGIFSRVDCDEENCFVTGSEGLVVFRRSDLKELAYAAVSGIKDVWAKGDSMVLLATSSGIVYFNKSEISLQEDLSDKLNFYANYPSLPSNQVLSIDGLSESYVFAGTVSGVVLISGGDHFYRSTEFQNVRAVSIAPDGALYYGGVFGLAAKRTNITDPWLADYVLDEDTVPPMYPVNAIDIAMSGSQRVIGAATSSGVALIEEKSIIGNSDIIQLFIQD